MLFACFCKLNKILKPRHNFFRQVNMGRRKKKNSQKNKTRSEDANGRKGYSEIVKINEDFEKYYQMQEIVPVSEWSQFMETLRQNLPASFRITGYKGQAKALLNIIRGRYFDELLKAKNSGKDVSPPFCLPWYPDNLAWQMTLSRVVIRTSEELRNLHNFLVSETETGNISRQETVSMIPPILLDVQPHHKVLDMCAAPGSKTSQVIEFLHRVEGKIPDGLLVANDVDNKRCYMLVHQAKRLNSPCFIITNNDATNLPNIRIDKGSMCVNLKYDRILCDVPCSGDGTVRKTPDIWTKWNTANANSLHCLQLKIVKRGLELLALHGRMVYSTCSLNPIENEAVISGILQCTGDAIELVDVSDVLCGMKTCKGLYDWKVTTRQLEVLEKFEDVPEKYLRQFKPSMFPPSPDLAKSMQLERCLRVLPHHQDTGGFFVAVLQKVKPKLPWESESDSHQYKQEPSSPLRKKLKVFNGYKEDPFIFLTDDDFDWPLIRNFYDLKGFDHTQILCRCEEGKKRNLYFVSAAVKNIVQKNAGLVKIINTGVRMFCRSENKDATCPYRLTQEGIRSILPFMNKRKINVSKEDLVLTLSNEFVGNETFSLEVQEQFAILESGCTVLIYTENAGTPDEFSIEISGWKGKLTFRCYVPKPDRAHFLRICGVDVTDYEKREKKRFKIAAETSDMQVEETDSTENKVCDATAKEKDTLEENAVS